MKIVSISLDPKILDPRSRVSLRNQLYGEVVAEYRVVVHSEKDSISERPHAVTVYSVGHKYKFVRFFKIIKLLRQFIKEGNCDVIASSDPYFMGFAALLLARFYGVGFELQILGIGKSTLLRKILTRYVIKHAGSIRVNSTHLRDNIMAEFGISQAEVLFVPIHYVAGDLGLSGILPGSDAAKVQTSLRHEFHTKYPNTFNLLTVGHLVSEQNVAMQIKAVQQLSDNNHKVHLHIVGNGAEKRVLQRLATKLQVSDCVTFHDEEKGLALGVLYTEADALLLTANIEGWPMTIFDAVRANLPIVMTDVGCAGEFIKNEVNGLVVPVNDVPALAEAIIKLMDNSALAETFTKTARLHFDNYWSLDKILSGYKQSWEKALTVARNG